MCHLMLAWFTRGKRRVKHRNTKKEKMKKRYREEDEKDAEEETSFATNENTARDREFGVEEREKAVPCVLDYLSDTYPQCAKWGSGQEKSATLWISKNSLLSLALPYMLIGLPESHCGDILIWNGRSDKYSSKTGRERKREHGNDGGAEVQLMENNKFQESKRRAIESASIGMNERPFADVLRACRSLIACYVLVLLLFEICEAQ
ncbi:hypothetical protein X798_02206 [Onchocerca flexuosa]|uniref:Transmembrane protein n=2 Tax=Onchocerca flexuosa TaxID=387005 RepID=A0A183HZP1_9BILA|nr:hypothetical protein X798_02206 [Onchocerca flexuosa]VDP12574.1 unnamed protein product [Onchocerca flexuosa]